MTKAERTVGARVLCNGGYPGTITRVCEWSESLVEVRLNRGTVCVDIADCTSTEMTADERARLLGHD